MKRFVLAAMLLAASPAFADDDGDCPAMTAVTAANNGQCVSVPNGGTLTLSVRTNGGIPYRWVVTGDGAPNLSVDEGSTTPATPGLMGGGASVTFTFTAEQAGETSIAAELQPINGGDASQSVSIAVHVTDGGD